ncbi:MAG: endonuclease III [Thermoplasmatota archaeon]
MPRESKAAKKERAAEILARLAKTYPPRHPFLAGDSPFQILSAIILSAQCTDAQVNRVTPALFARYPTPQALAAAKRRDVERIVFSTGFYRNKAKNLQEMALALVTEHDGEVPRAMDALLTLPGVGRKTANVLQGNAWNISEGVCVDTHVGRLARRLGFSREDDAEKVERDLMATFEPRDWQDVSYLLILHGREVCDARKPACERCEVAALCPSAFKVPRSRPRARAAGARSGKKARQRADP